MKNSKSKLMLLSERNLAGFSIMVNDNVFQDHAVVPDNERELCFHKQACTYKPYCIFFHPEGQGEERRWKQNTNKIAKICRYAEQGETCMRSVCTFYHPASRNNFPTSRNSNNVGFHWDQFREPPLSATGERMTSTRNVPSLPVRIPVIVRSNLKSRQEFPYLSRSLKGLSLD